MFQIVFLKLFNKFLRRFTSFSGTALTGLILEKYFPRTQRKLFAKIENLIVITGTNGKTTTAEILRELFEADNIKYFSNKSGSNMIRGMLSSMIDNYCTVCDEYKCEWVIFEVEEATLPKLTELVKPKLIIVTNLFRDQLDAYGELDKTLSYIKKGIEQSDNPILILNGNDKRVLSLRNVSKNKKAIISFDDKLIDQIKLEEYGDEEVNVKPEEQPESYQITNFEVSHEDLAIIFELVSKNSSRNIKLQIPGLFTAFNASAALVGFETLFAENNDVNKNNIEVLSKIKPAFGRGERAKINSNNSTIQTFLVKNPAGMNLNLQLLGNFEKKVRLVFGLNDKIADGQDVSWIWDSDIELVRKIKISEIFVYGSRAYDMALRLNYAGIDNIKLIDDLGSFFEKLNQDKEESYTIVLPTYTAMTEMRKIMVTKFKLQKIW